jgi:hypothetical protein
MRRSEYHQAAKLVDNAALRQKGRRNVPRLQFIIPSGQPWGALGRVVGNFIGVSTRRFCGAARDNGPVCFIAAAQPPAVSGV